jgi:hypothetical protein
VKRKDKSQGRLINYLKPILGNFIFWSDSKAVAESQEKLILPSHSVHSSPNFTEFSE